MTENTTGTKVTKAENEVTIIQILEHYGLMNRMRRIDDSLIGACPIHRGKNENAFSININLNHWKCHSNCGREGDAVDFVSQMEKTSRKHAALLIRQWFKL